MKQFGLIGYPLSHSFSKGYFAEKFKKENITDARYDVFPIENMADFEQLCRDTPNLAGLNVTIPHKQSVIPFLDVLDEAAAQVGAVNTIKFAAGKKIGYNSDIYGFEMSLKPLLDSRHRFALILGTGGASKAVEYVLKKLAVDFQYVSRTKTETNISYADIDEALMAKAKIIINTSPLGMYPNIDAAPDIPYQHVTNEHLLYDLVYNPEETLFLKNGKAQGATTKNGLEMLHLQAERSWEIWNQV
jgi:shikimate dehydrogenase